MTRRLPLLVLCASLVLATTAAPVASGAAPSVRAAAVPTDAYDATDDSRALATTSRNLTPYLAYGEPRVERHVLGASSAAGPADEDWFRIDVSPAEAEAATYLFEAKALAAGLDPVIEIYSADTSPTAYSSLPFASGRTVADPLAVAFADGAAWIAGGSTSLDFLPPSAGSYLVRVRPYYGAEGTGFKTGYGAYDLRVKRGHATRLAGADRIATAVAVSQERFADGALAGGSVVIANGYGFADALAGSTLAGALRGPLLLTAPKTLPAAVRAEIVRLRASRVYVIGGGAAVSEAVSGALAKIPGVSVQRVKGANRFETAAAVARRADGLRAGGVARVAFVASGASFPDALSAAPMAAHNVAAVLLTTPAGLSSATRSALRDPALGITDVVIVGGPQAVSARVEAEVAAVLGGKGHVRRLAGDDRYRTSAAFAIWATANGSGAGKVGTTLNPSALDALAFSRMGLASGADFPDALAGGVACGLAGAPVLLTAPARFSPFVFAGLDPFDTVHRGADYYSRGSVALGRSYAFGGVKALTAEVVGDLDQWVTGHHASTY